MRFSVPLPTLLLLVPALLLHPQTASAAAMARSDTTAIASTPATRAIGVSEPVPGDLGVGRILIAPMGEGPGEQFGNSVASAGDVNGDGYADVIVGAWTSDTVAGDAGSAYVYFGGPAADDVPDLTFHGQSYGDNFGTSVSSAGDVNGDGFGDLIVGAWRSFAGGSLTGRAYIFHGGPAADEFPDRVLIGAAFDDRFGLSVASAGDVNADGFSDVLVGAAGNDAGGTDAGRAYIYFGGPGSDAVTDVILTGAAAGDGFGWAVASAGDANGDGFADVVVGAYGNGTAGFEAGRAYVYFGGPGLDNVADRVFTGEAAGDHFGVDVSPAGDVNGDGYVDLIATADLNDGGGTNAGRAYLFHGGPGADTVADLILTGAAAGDQLGFASAAGDMNGDGFGDLLVGAWLNDTRATDAGRTYVYYGGPGADAIPDIAFTGEGGGDRLGVSVASAGDFNADGQADVIIGAYFNDWNGADAGRAYVVTSGTSHAPFVTAPATVSGNAGSLISFSVTASDPDADAITSLTASPLPAGATFTPNASKTSGLFSWTPGPAQGGGYAVTFTASNDLSGSAMTSITVATPNLSPSLDPVADMSVDEGGTADQLLHGGDPDGDTLVFGLVSGPGFASVTTIDATSGNLHLAPGVGDEGSYAATVRASDGRGGVALRSLAIAVIGVNDPPVLTVPAGVFGAEGVFFSLPISAYDPDGEHVTLGALNRPVGSLFVDLGTNVGSFSWTPGFGQAGTYIVTFTGRDDLGAEAAPRDLAIVVDNVNRGPAAAAGGPYSGIVNLPVVFDGTASSDPDGDVLSYHWEYGDLATGTGPNPSHAYGSGGTFTVRLEVSDGTLVGSALATATIQDVFPADAFLEGGNQTTRLGSRKGTTCAQIEPVDRSYGNTSVDIASIVMISPGTGSVDRISAIGDKTTIGTDRDRDGIDEITACFAKDDLRLLFDALPSGRRTVGVTLEGTLTTGGTFRAALDMDVVASGGGPAASVSPNPLNPEGVLTYVTTKPGAVTVTVFDLGGRLVRTLLRDAFVPSGYHDASIDGRGDNGARLASGVYYYRVETAEGVATGRFAILK